MNRTLDCIGMACPKPVIEAKKALQEFTEAGELTVLADNETCVANLTKLAESLKLPVRSAKTGEKRFEVVISAVPGAAEQTGVQPEYVSCEVPQRGGAAVVLSANTMGSGDPELGKALMKAFIFALSSAPETPEVILCYNSGAYLTCEGSDSLEDFRALEQAGAKILTCGTCLNFYGLTEKLAVGTVTNMYSIVEEMQKAARIIRP